MAATEPEFQSFIDRLDMMFSRRTAKESDYMQSLGERMESALGEGIDTLDTAVDDFEASVSEISTGSGPAIESITTSAEGFEESADEMQDTQEELIEAFEGKSEEELNADEIVPQIEGLAEESAETIQEKVNRVNEVFRELAAETDTSEEELEELRTSFSDFQNDIVAIQRQVEEEEVKTSQVRSQITAAVENIQTDIETTFDGGDQVQEAVSDLKQLPDLLAGQLSAGQQQASIAQTAADPELYGASAEVTRFAMPQTEVGGVLEGLKSKAAEFKNTLAGASPLITAINVGIAGIVAPLGIAVDLLEDTFSVAKDFREETGIGAERMEELRQTTAEVSSELATFGVGPDAIAGMQTAFVEAFGSIENAVERTGKTQEQLLTDTAALSQGFAMSASEAAKLQATLQEIETTTGLSSDHLATATREIAMQNEVAPQKAMEQITENSEALAKYAGTSEERLAEAAVQAQRLGTSLESVTQFQEQALDDVTGTVEGLQQASMVTGQAFDSASLLQASFEGTDETLDEIESQLSNISSQEFENMNALQKQSLEDAFGIPASEIASIIEGREALEGLNTTAERAQAVAAGEASFDQAISEDAIGSVQNLQNQFNALYFTIAEELYPVVSDFADTVIPALVSTVEFLTPVVKTFGKVLFSVLGAIGSIVEVIRGDFSAASEQIESVGQMFGFFEENTKKAEESVGFLNASLQAIGFTLGALAVSSIATSIGGALVSSLITATTAAKSFGIYLTTFSGSILPAVGSALSTAASSVYAFATSLTATGVGGVILGLTAAVSGLVYAFYNWEETVQFVKNSINSFTESLFGVESGFEVVSNAFNFLSDAITQSQPFRMAMIGATLLREGLDSLFDGIEFVIDKISQAISKFYEGKSAGQAFGSTVAVILDWISPLDELIERLGIVYDMFSDLGSAVMEGNFDRIPRIILDSVADLGFNLIDRILPDSATEYLESKLSGVGETIMSYLPKSPADEGPLSRIEEVDVGGTIAKQIQPEPVKKEMEKTTSVVQETAEQGMNVQPAQQDVATVETGTEQAQQQQQPQASVDVDDSGIKKLLTQIRDGQRQLIQSLKNGEIAVYLDGRKVNKELLRKAGFSG